MFPRSSPILLLLVLLAVSTLALLVSLAPSPAAAVPIPAPKKAAGHGHRLAAAVAPEAADVEDVRAEALDFIDRAQAVVEEYADAAGIDVDAADDDDDDDCKEKKKHGIRGFFQGSAGSSRARGNSSA
ncbi:hypothetical protein DFJ73DRAFT_807234, partial [Zopfochytrium polystomum]